MIEMADDEAAIIEPSQLMEERHGIAPAGDADEIALARGKILQRFRLETDRAFGIFPHGSNASFRLAARQSNASWKVAPPSI